MPRCIVGRLGRCVGASNRIGGIFEPSAMSTGLMLLITGNQGECQDRHLDTESRPASSSRLRETKQSRITCLGFFHGSARLVHPNMSLAGGQQSSFQLPSDEVRVGICDAILNALFSWLGRGEKQDPNSQERCFRGYRVHRQ